MRHLFYVQSNLSCLVCEAIVLHRKLSTSDILFILDRGTDPPRRYASIVAPKRLRSAIRDSFRQILENLRVRKDLHARFSEYSEGDTFEIYVNRMNYPFLEVAEGHSAWRATHLYEEGLAAYYRGIGSEPLHVVSSLVAKIRFRMIRWISGYGLFKACRTFYTSEYSRVYATSDRAFVGFPRREIVSLERAIAEHPKNNDDTTLPRDSLIFVLPLHNAFSNDVVSAQRLLISFSDVIKAFPNRPIILKPHPDFFTDHAFWEKFYLDLGKLIGRNILSNVCSDLPLEKTALLRKDVIFCVVISSLGAYTEAFKAKIISVAPAVFGKTHPFVEKFKSVSPGVLFFEELGETPNALNTYQQVFEV